MSCSLSGRAVLIIVLPARLTEWGINMQERNAAATRCDFGVQSLVNVRYESEWVEGGSGPRPCGLSRCLCDYARARVRVVRRRQGAPLAKTGRRQCDAVSQAVAFHPVEHSSQAVTRAIRRERARQRGLGAGAAACARPAQSCLQRGIWATERKRDAAAFGPPGCCTTRRRVAVYGETWRDERSNGSSLLDVEREERGCQRGRPEWNGMEAEADIVGGRQVDGCRPMVNPSRPRFADPTSADPAEADRPRYTGSAHQSERKLQYTQSRGSNQTPSKSLIKMQLREAQQLIVATGYYGPVHSVKCRGEEPPHVLSFTGSDFNGYVSAESPLHDGVGLRRPLENKKSFDDAGCPQMRVCLSQYLTGRGSGSAHDREGGRRDQGMSCRTGLGFHIRPREDERKKKTHPLAATTQPTIRDLNQIPQPAADASTLSHFKPYKIYDVPIVPSASAYVYVCQTSILTTTALFGDYGASGRQIDTDITSTGPKRPKAWRRMRQTSPVAPPVSTDRVGAKVFKIKAEAPARGAPRPRSPTRQPSPASREPTHASSSCPSRRKSTRDRLPSRESWDSPLSCRVPSESKESAVVLASLTATSTGARRPERVTIRVIRSVFLRFAVALYVHVLRKMKIRPLSAEVAGPDRDEIPVKSLEQDPIQAH
ncbi:hypothetical protein DFH06DRAFT_1131874 [Mycena polygramma]|nr:hypothetical protein DFH06DRAFT_1131874 [Mycena polygramma]